MNNKTQNGGIEFSGILGIVFIVLKLCGKIAWSWWWVLAPIWAPFVVAAIIISILLIMDEVDKNKRKKLFRDKFGDNYKGR